MDEDKATVSIADNDKVTALVNVNHVMSEVHAYLAKRSITDPYVIDHLGWGVFMPETIRRVMQLSDEQCKYHGGLFVDCGERNGSSIGQLIVPPSLEMDRASFIPVGKGIKLNTRGEQMLFLSPERDEYADEHTLYVCESAVKAAALWVRGYQACSGAGVASVWTQKRGFIDGWERVDTLVKSGVITRIRVLFDSDVWSNANVQRAVETLLLALRGKYPSISVDNPRIPAEWGEKLGIDDVLAEWLGEEGGEEALRARLSDFLDGTHPDLQGDPREASRERFNAEMCKVMKPEALVLLDDGYVTSIQARKDMMAHRDFTAVDENGRAQKVSAVKDWVSWEGANVVERITYAPGERSLQLGEVGGFFNTWRDTGCGSVEGDGIQPFLDVYRNALGGDDVALNELLDSFGWIMQHRGQKLPRTIYAVGASHGSGKSSLAYLMGDVMGASNFSSISSTDLSSEFNASIVSKELVLLDDVYGLSGKQVATLKRYATDPTLMVVEKWVRAYQIDNHLVMFLTANQLQALPLEKGDRRALVLLFNPTVQHPPGGEHWQQYFAWLDGGGREAMRYHLEHRDVSAFNPNAVPASEGRAEIAGGSNDALEDLLLAIEHDRAEALGSERRLWSAQELIEIAYGTEERYSRSELCSMGKQISQHFPKALAHAKTSLTRWKGKQLRFLAIAPPPCGAKHWTPDLVRAHLAEHDPE